MKQIEKSFRIATCDYNTLPQYQKSVIRFAILFLKISCRVIDITKISGENATLHLDSITKYSI